MSIQFSWKTVLFAVLLPLSVALGIVLLMMGMNKTQIGSIFGLFSKSPDQKDPIPKAEEEVKTAENELKTSEKEFSDSKDKLDQTMAEVSKSQEQIDREKEERDRQSEKFFPKS